VVVNDEERGTRPGVFHETVPVLAQNTWKKNPGTSLVVEN
jgi:hypothetical protein